MKESAHFDYAQCKQKGIIDPKIIIGGIIALVVIFFIATGNFKFSTSVNKNANKPSSQENQQPTQVPQSKPKSYQNEKYGITLEYPESWSLKESSSAVYIATFLSPKESSSDNFSEFLGIKVVDTTSKPNITLQEVADLWENQTKSASTSEAFVVADRKSSTLSGEEAKDIEYTAKIDDINAKGMVRIVLKNNKAYIFQYNAEATSYDKYLPDIETILASVTL